MNEDQAGPAGDSVLFNKIDALGTIAEEQAKAGDRQASRETLRQALRIARPIEDESRRYSTFIESCGPRSRRRISRGPSTWSSSCKRGSSR